MKQLKDVDGVWRDRDSRAENVVRDYFQNLFTSNGGNLNDILRLISRRINVSQNEELERDLLKEEANERRKHYFLCIGIKRWGSMV